MIVSILTALALVSIALTFERVYLRPQRNRLRQVEQSFVFHRLRDDLQNLALEGRLQTTSRLYQTLSNLLNMGLQNSTTLRASQIAALAKKSVRAEVPTDSDFVSYVKQYDHDVQRFVAICFYEFSKMLLINDPFFAFGRFVMNSCRFLVRRAWDPTHRLEPHPLLLSLFPQRAETYKTATTYRAIGDDLNAYAS